MIKKLQENEVFVFGSNLAGRHGAGAAKQAHKQFGAEMGVGEGMTGQSYAFPTLDGQLTQLPIKRLEYARNALYLACDKHREKTFLLTKVGCGLADYPESDMQALFGNPPDNLVLPDGWTKAETVLVMRTCNADMRSSHEKANGFQWPAIGYVFAPDWDATPECGGGLHGLLWGEGDGSLLDFRETAKGLVVRVEKSTVVSLDGKIKYPSGHVVFCGDLKGAADFISAAPESIGRAIVSGTATAGVRGTATAGVRGTATAGVRGTATAGVRGTATAGYSGTATAGVRGTATAGYRGTATAGDSGTATAGYRGTATAGYRGTATAGDRGTATAGYGGTATAGVSGVIAIQYWNGKRFKIKIGYVKDEDGDGELEPNVPYRLNDAGEFVRVDEKEVTPNEL